MIQSMTAYGSARAENAAGALNVECRSVNGRFLDIHFRLPDDLRMMEGALRQIIAAYVARGKLELRVTVQRRARPALGVIDPELVSQLAHQLAEVRRSLPDARAPGLLELLQWSADDTVAEDPDVWSELCLQACHQAMAQLQQAREREGQRLADAMLANVAAMQAQVDTVATQLPQLEREQQERIAQRLRDALQAVSPEGFARIGGEELSARIAQEAALFSLRNDVAEELTRLRSHFQEVRSLLGAADARGNRKGSTGKRLDFLCQELNREANTLGSKAAGMDITRAAIDLKLLIEQLREQVQNIE